MDIDRINLILAKQIHNQLNVGTQNDKLLLNIFFLLKTKQLYNCFRNGFQLVVMLVCYLHFRYITLF